MSINVNPCKSLILLMFSLIYLDSTKKYEFGGSQLENNPLTNPKNSYQFNYNRMRQNFPTNLGPVAITNPADINIGSARIRQTTNNLIINN
jgi:hypothetical protein